MPIFFKLLISSSAVESTCLVDLQVAMIKLSAIDDLFSKFIILRFSAFASSKIDKIVFDIDKVLIFASKFFPLVSNFS